MSLHLLALQQQTKTGVEKWEAIISLWIGVPALVPGARIEEMIRWGTAICYQETKVATDGQTDRRVNDGRLPSGVTCVSHVCRPDRDREKDVVDVRLSVCLSDGWCPRFHICTILYPAERGSEEREALATAYIYPANLFWRYLSFISLNAIS